MNEMQPDSGASDCRKPALLQRRGFVSTVVFFISLVLLGAGWLLKGDANAAVRPDSDDFVMAGEAIISWMTTGAAGLKAMQAHAVYPHYFIPSVLLASVYQYFNDPVIKVVALNSVLFSLIVVFLYRFWITVHGTWSHWSGKRGFMIGVIGGLYIVFGLPDPFLLSYTVLTDIIFLFWVCLFMVATARGILAGGRLVWMVAFFMAATAPFVRPTGILLPVLLLYGLGIKALIESDIRARTLGMASIAVPVVITFLIVPSLVSMKINGHVWVDTMIPDVIQRHFNTAVYFFASGTVVSDRMETYVDTPSGYLDVLKMIVHRLVYYWVPLRFGETPYSPIHNLVNLVYVVVIWPLALIGIRRLIKANQRYQMAALFLVVAALSYAFLHSVTLVSFSWRYQLPAMVPLWMLAGTGFFTVLGYRVRTSNESAGARAAASN